MASCAAISCLQILVKSSLDTGYILVIDTISLIKETLKKAQIWSNFLIRSWLRRVGYNCSHFADIFHEEDRIQEGPFLYTALLTDLVMLAVTTQYCVCKVVFDLSTI